MSPRRNKNRTFRKNTTTFKRRNTSKKLDFSRSFEDPAGGGERFSSGSRATRLYPPLGLRVAFSNPNATILIFTNTHRIDMVHICYATAILLKRMSKQCATRHGHAFPKQSEKVVCSQKILNLTLAGCTSSFIPSYFLHQAMLPVHTYSFEGVGGYVGVVPTPFGALGGGQYSSPPHSI